MKYAIISDLHANREALEGVLKKIDTLGVDQVLNLGDVVGYYSHPNECVDIIRERKILSIMGNHDVVACGKVEPLYFNPTAAQAILWARQTLTDDNKEWLASLPDSRLINDELLIVHGSVKDRDEYLLFRPEIESSFLALENQHNNIHIVFFGHTHRRIFYEKESTSLYSGGKSDKLVLRKGARYLINPGSVGQPRDGDPRASFCTYDSEAAIVQYYRVPFDIDTVADAVKKLPFGESLARRLYRGV